jgi:LuxR family maltose regulon positive regulatory protein
MLHGQPRDPPTRLLRRPRIEAMLGESGLTIVSAGPGSGKTATVAAWAHATGWNGVWIDIGPSSSEASVHARIASGLHAIGVLAHAGASPVTGDPKARVLDAIERWESPLLLVMDGVRDTMPPEDRSAWLAEVAARVRRFPQLHVVLLGRSVPSIARSADAIELATAVTDDDLAYTWTEVAEALVAARVSAAAAFVTFLHAATAGIPVLVQVAASALTGQRVSAERPPPARAARLVEAVDAAVLGRGALDLDVGTLRVLRSASLLVDADVAEVASVADVSADVACAALDEAERRGWGRRWGVADGLFSFEPVIARTLALAFLIDGPSVVLARAARILSDRGEAYRALMMAFDAGDDDLVLRTAARHAAALAPHHERILVRLEEIPHARVAAQPLIAAAIAFCHAQNPHSRIAMLASYARAERLARDRSAHGRARDRVVLQLARSVAFLELDRPAWAVRAALSSVELLDALSPSETALLLVSPAVVYGRAAAAALAVGDVREARVLSGRAIGAQKASALVRHVEITRAALLAAVDGDLIAAGHQLDTASMRVTVDNLPLRWMRLATTAILDIEAGRREALTGDARATIGDAQDGPSRAVGAAVTAVSDLLSGGADAAVAGFRALLTRTAALSPSPAERRVLDGLLALALLAAGDASAARRTARSLGETGVAFIFRAVDALANDDALAALLASSSGLSAPHTIRVRTTLQLLRGVAACRLDRRIAAERDTRAAVVSLLDHGLRTPWFLVPGRDRTAVLALVEDLVPPESTLARELLASPSLPARSGPVRRAPQLTRRERAVLAGVFARETNGQMATRLGVSPNTVKKQRASLYAKLGVNSWEDAVHVAVEHGLLDVAD